MARKTGPTAAEKKAEKAAIKAARDKKIADLSKYIWSLRGKCPMITDVNKDLITQYCQFAVLGGDISTELAEKIDDMLPLEAKVKLEQYQTVNKITLGLYKTLGLGDIKDKKADNQNKFMRAALDAEKEGDF
nr:MAG TPA: hypothetical protein [Bacteriophage sp.]